MTRKHFTAIAEIVRWARENVEDDDHAVTYAIAHDLAHYFATTNPHFDRERFLRATGVRDAAPMPEPAPSYTLAEVRDGTGWPEGVRFKVTE